MLDIDNESTIDLRKEQKKKLFYIFCIALITTTVFIYSVEIREPWYGELYGDNHQWLSGSTLKFADYWYQEGPENLYWGMIENPNSIEFSTLLSRNPYPSYPPGVVVPIYVISKILNEEPNPSILMGYNLFNHFLIAFFMSLLVFIFLSRNLGYDSVISFLFALIPIFLELLWPAPLYWHQNVFFSDQAIILPFVLMVFLEILRFDSSEINLKYINLLQGILIFIGFLTDWFFVFITVTIFVKRILSGEIQLLNRIPYIDNKFLKKSFMFWAPGILAMILFIVQLNVLGVLWELPAKFYMRTGVTNLHLASSRNVFNVFISDIDRAYGQLAEIVLFITIFVLIILSVMFIYKKLKNYKPNLKIKKILCLLWIVYLPCLTQFFLLKSHSVVHEFSVLKFSFPIAISFVLIPILICLTFLDFRKVKSKFINERKLLIMFLIVSLLLMSYSTAQNNPDRLKFFDLGPSYAQAGYDSLGDSIKYKTGYNDILFSPDFEIPENPPQALYYSKKRVYKINSTNEIRKKITDLNGSYNILIIFLNQPSEKWNQFIKNATKIPDNNYYIYRIQNSDLKQ